MTRYLAQVNIATPRMSRDDEGMAYVINNLFTVFDLAERSKGFVWRLDNYEEAAEAKADVFGDPELFLNISVWENIEDFQQFVFNTVHSKFLVRRDEWFFPPDEPSTVLWWVEEGHKPSVQEAHERLQLLRKEGPGPSAFSLTEAFDVTGAPVGSLVKPSQ